MTLPRPIPGLVVSYSYLWLREARNGAEEGRKDRPTAIVVIRKGTSDKEIVTVLPISHSAPLRQTDAVALPPAIKQMLGLDDAPSWVVLTEANEFIWPGPDIRRVSPGVGGFSHGVLPPRFFRHLRERLLDSIEAGRFRKVRRPE